MPQVGNNDAQSLLVGYYNGMLGAITFSLEPKTKVRLKSAPLYTLPSLSALRLLPADCETLYFLPVPLIFR